MALSDQIAVMFNGELTGWVKAEETDENELGLMMSGSIRKGSRKHEKKRKLAAPLIAVLLGLLVGMIIVIASGKSPVLLISAIVKSFCGFDILAPGPINPRYFGEFIVFSMPLILTGLAVGFAYRTGLFNIGGEGQVMVGALAATVVGILVPLPPVLHAIVCLIAGGVAGALWAFYRAF